MTNLSKVKEYFENEITKLEGVIEKEKFARDNAPSAMESHSDTTKSQKEDLVVALEAKLNKLKLLITTITDNTPENTKIRPWSIINIEKVGQALIVPEGLGGVKVDNYMLVSIDSPIIKNLF